MLTQLLALLPPHTAQLVLAGMVALAACANLARLLVSNGTKTAFWLDKLLGVLPMDLHKATGSSAHADAPGPTKAGD